MNTNPELKELSIYLATDYAAFILAFIEFFTSQYEEDIETSTFPPYQALTTVLYLTDLIFEYVHGVCTEVMDAGQHVPGIFLWVIIKAWEIKELYLQNKIKDDPSLTRRLVRRMLVHDGEQYFKVQLEKIDKHEERNISLHAKVTENHK